MVQKVFHYVDDVEAGVAKVKKSLRHDSDQHSMIDDKANNEDHELKYEAEIIGPV